MIVQLHDKKRAGTQIEKACREVYGDAIVDRLINCGFKQELIDGEYGVPLFAFIEYMQSESGEWIDLAKWLLEFNDEEVADYMARIEGEYVGNYITDVAFIHDHFEEKWRLSASLCEFIDWELVERDYHRKYYFVWCNGEDEPTSYLFNFGVCVFKADVIPHGKWQEKGIDPVKSIKTTNIIAKD